MTRFATAPTGNYNFSRVDLRIVAGALTLAGAVAFLILLSLMLVASLLVILLLVVVAAVELLPTLQLRLTVIWPTVGWLCLASSTTVTLRANQEIHNLVELLQVIRTAVVDHTEQGWLQPWAGVVADRFEYQLGPFADH